MLNEASQPDSQMSYTRETMTAFSTVLKALHTGGTPDSALRLALPKLGALFRSLEVFCYEVPPDAWPLDDALLRADFASDLRLIVRQTDSVLTITFRRYRSFSEDEAELGLLLQQHIAFLLRTGRPDAGREPVLVAHFHRLRERGLTPRECDVVFWMAQGKRDAEIGIILSCAAKTVSKHVERVLAKLGAETRLAAAHAALEWLECRC